MKISKGKIFKLKQSIANALFFVWTVTIVSTFFFWKEGYLQPIYLLAILLSLPIIMFISIRMFFLEPLKKLSILIPDKKDKNDNEVQLIIKSYNSLQNAITTASEFIKNIEQGKLDEDYSEDSDNSLKTSLLSMRDHLKKISNQEKERIWISEGLAKFSDLLRDSGIDFNTFCYNILSNLIKYLNVNQGAIFIKQQNADLEEEEYMEMAACYAYDRKKFLDKKIIIGNGLIGQVWIEKEKVYLTDIPQNYLEITSGLGDSNPDCLLIVPLKVNEEVVGILELASFNLIADYKVEFIEKLSESLASTILTLKINDQTRRLLEESQQMTEEMRAQEEEMRQNMEELSATQEELKRKEMELDRRLKEALEKIELSHVNQQINEISLQIEHNIDSSKRDLKFLSNVPPVQGIIRALENNNFDLQSNSSLEDWIERMDTIFRNFLLQKELFQSITFTDEQGNVIYELTFKGEELTRSLTETLDCRNKEAFINTSQLESEEVYVGNMKKLTDNSLVMEFGIPVFNDKKVLKATILMNLFADIIIDDIISKEDGKNKFALFTSEGTCIYGNNKNLKSEGLKKTVVTNKNQMLGLTIMHQ